MALQSIIVALLVLGSSVYAGWTLMPRVARAALATSMLHWPLPAMLANRLRRSVRAGSGCGCDGCDHAAPKARAGTVQNGTVQKITFHPRVPR